MERNNQGDTMRDETKLQDDTKYIAYYYGVPAKVGGRIRYTGNPGGDPVFGTITGTEQARLLVRLDGHNTSVPLHPTWKIQYRQDEP